MVSYPTHAHHSCPAPLQSSSDGGKAGSNLFGALFSKLTGGKSGDSKQESAPTPAPAEASSSSWGRQQSGALASADDSEGESSGMYLYGAVCMVLHGDVVLDTISSLVSWPG